MAERYLGAEFDIHGGGLDLRFPHHENEQAQSRAAGDGFAQYWLHNGWVTLGGEKMSKSLGNTALVDEVVKRVRPVELRYYLVAPHYRSTIEFTDAALDEAGAGLPADRVLRAAGPPSGWAPTPAQPVLCADFTNAMDDDLGTPAAVAAIHEMVREGNTALAGGDDARGRRRARLGAGHARRARPRPARPAVGRRRRRPAGPGHRRAGRRWPSSSGRPPAPARTSPRPTRSATSSPRLGVSVEDTPQGPRWELTR